MSETQVVYAPDADVRQVSPLLMRVGDLIETARDKAAQEALRFYTISFSCYDEQRTSVTVTVMRPSTRAWYFAVARIEYGDLQYVLDADHREFDMTLDKLYEACEQAVG